MSSFPSSEFPMVGFRFCPTDERLLSYYLQRKINCESCGDVIQDMDVYSREPWLLPHKTHPLFEENQWFYFTKLVQASPKGNGKRPKRKISGELSGGYWRASTGKTDVLSATGQLLGFKKILSFCTYKKHKVNEKTASVTSGWIMTEYWLNSQSFQDQVICHIRHNVNRSRCSAAATEEEIMRQGCMAMWTTEGSVPPEFLDDATVMTEAAELRQIQDQTNDVFEACPMALPNESDLLGHAPTVPCLPSQSSFPCSENAVVTGVAGLDAAESVQEDLNMEETPVAEDEQWLEDLVSAMRAEDLDLPEIKDDEIYMIEAPDVPWMEDQSVGVSGGLDVFWSTL